jgi:hypothetical protein
MRTETPQRCGRQNSSFELSRKSLKLKSCFIRRVFTRARRGRGRRGGLGWAGKGGVKLGRRGCVCVCGEKGDNRSPSRFREPEEGEGDVRAFTLSAGSVLPFLDRSEGKALPARPSACLYLLFHYYSNLAATWTTFGLLDVASVGR